MPLGAIARVHVAERIAEAIAATANVTGATRRIGGLRYGGTPVEPRLIRPGAIQLDVDKQGYKPAHVSVDVLAGVVTDVALELEPADAKPAARPPSSPPSAPRSGKPAPTPPRPAKPSPAKLSPA